MESFRTGTQRTASLQNGGPFDTPDEWRACSSRSLGSTLAGASRGSPSGGAMRQGCKDKLPSDERPLARRGWVEPEALCCFEHPPFLRSELVAR